MAIAFYILAFLIVGSAILVITSKNIVHSAIFLILAFLSVAGLYILLSAEFIAAIQILVYAGGIMVLFLFMILLVSFRELKFLPAYHRQSIIAVFLAVLLFAAVGYLLFGKFAIEPADAAILSAEDGNTGTVAMTLFTKYLFPFELASLFLLSAMIGAIVLAKKDI